MLVSSRTLLSIPPVTARVHRPWCFPKPTQPRRAPAQWARTILSSVPVRGSTRPSNPPSLSRLEEVYPKAESPKAIYFFLFGVVTLWGGGRYGHEHKSRWDTVLHTRTNRWSPTTIIPRVEGKEKKTSIIPPGVLYYVI